MRFVTQQVHAILDYPVAANLIITPFLLNLGASNPLALWLSVATGIAALLLTILTNHETGLIKVLPYSFHLLVDRIVGIVFAVAPFIFGFQGVDAAFYWINAAAVLAVTFVFNAPGRPARKQPSSLRPLVSGEEREVARQCSALRRPKERHVQLHLRLPSEHDR